MRKFFRKTHKWLALPVGIIITITCFTGAVLVFKQEILEFAHPEHYFVEEIKDTAIPLDQLVEMVNEQLGAGVTVTDVKIPADLKRTYTMSQSEGFRISVFVDPYTGKVVGKHEFKGDIFWDMMVLHRWLMDGTRTWGKYTVGISTFLMVFILISGIVLWKPKKKKNLKAGLTIKTSAGRKRLFYDLHNVLGAYACLILLVCCLTGLMWSFDWYRNGVFKLFGAEVVESRGGKGPGRGDGSSKGKQQGREKPTMNTTHWQAMYELVAKENLTNEYVRVSNGEVSVHDKRAFRSRQSDSYFFDVESGMVTKKTLYSDKAKSMQVWGWVYSFHVGDYFGIWSKIFTCLASLIGASLPLTGYYLFYNKSKRKKRKKQ